MVFQTPLTAQERIDRMRENAQRFRCPRLHQSPKGIKRGLLSICGFGPSLADTWKDIKGRVMTTSGAHDFLIERGVIPKYHVETDPREHKVNFVRNSHPDVTYLINSQCHPKMFELLEGRKVVMWHGFTNDDAANQVVTVETIDPGGHLLGGGTNVGMRAIIVARELGYTRFELHGMDCCYRNGQQWAGEHFTKLNYPIHIKFQGRVFETSEQMLKSADDFINSMPMLRGCTFKIHGDGLLEAVTQMLLRGGREVPTRFKGGLHVGEPTGGTPKLRRAA